MSMLCESHTPTKNRRVRIGDQSSSRSRLVFRQPLATGLRPTLVGLSESKSVTSTSSRISDITRSGSWIGKAIDTLNGFRFLKPGWNGYKAQPPTEWSIEIAQQVCEYFHSSGLNPTRIAPSAANGIGITIRHLDREAYIEIYNSQDIYALLETAGGEPTIRPVRLASNTDFETLVRELRDYLGT